MMSDSIRRRFSNSIELRHASVCNRRISADLVSGFFSSGWVGFGLCDVLDPSFFCSIRSVFECEITDLLVCRESDKLCMLEVFS